jgi:hypothetical protein
MSSTAQVLANRQNSLHSTGPVTAAGKAASSQNARSHGLTSKQIVLPGEDPAEYDAARARLIRDYAPANETERTLVEEIAAGSWRLARARRHETAILKKLIGSDVDLDTAFATLFVEKPKELARLLRYVTTIERAYYRALNKLEKLQKDRARDEHDNSLIAAWAASETPVGFVSQSVSASAPERPCTDSKSAPGPSVSRVLLTREAS